MKEQISALLDGEGNDLERERVLRALGTDPALRGVWERYHLASAAIRRELEVMVSPGLADRIHERLQHEAQENTARRSLSPRVLKFTAGLALDKIRLVKLTVLVASVPEFFEQHLVANGACRVVRFAGGICSQFLRFRRQVRHRSAGCLAKFLEAPVDFLFGVMALVPVYVL